MRMYVSDSFFPPEITIGLEHTSFEVDEDAGNVTVCVQLIMRDGQDIRSLGSNLFRVDVTTAHTNGENGECASIN